MPTARRQLSGRALMRAVLAATLFACGGKESGAPLTTVPSDTATTVPAPTPAILSIASDTVLTVNEQTRVSLVGTGFRSDMAVEIVSQNTSPRRFVGSDLLNVSGTTVDVLVTLDVAGVWSIQVVSASGEGSNLRNLVAVVTVVPPTPDLIRLDPATLVSDSAPTSLRVVGKAIPLPVQLTVTNPSGSSIPTAAFSIQSASDSGFTLSSIFADIGTWQMRLADGPTAPTGHALAFTVQPRPPQVSSVTPARVSTPARDFTIDGSGFQAGATVQLFAPGSVTATAPIGIISQSASSIAFSAALSIVGVWSVRVRNPDGGLSAAATVESVAGPAVYVILAPGWITGGTSARLTLLGRGFDPNVAVTGNGFNLVTLAVSNATSTSVDVDATVLRQPNSGILTVVVTNPSTAAFTMVGPPDAPGIIPTILSVTPQNLVANKTPQTITINSSCCTLTNVGVTLEPPAGFGAADPVYAPVVLNVPGSISVQVVLSTPGTWRLYVTVGGRYAEKPILINVNPP